MFDKPTIAVAIRKINLKNIGRIRIYVRLYKRTEQLNFGLDGVVLADFWDDLSLIHNFWKSQLGSSRNPGYSQARF